MNDGKAPIHVRTIRVEAVESGDDELTVTGSLVDERPRRDQEWWGSEAPLEIHHMRVSLRVGYPDLTIRAVEGRMPTHPYLICPDALPPLQQLVGLSVQQGFTRAVNERCGRAAGCSQLTALHQAMAPVVRQAAGAAFRRDSGLDLPAAAERWFVDTCQAWRENGPLHRLLKRGDRAGLQAMTAYGAAPAEDPAGRRDTEP